MKRNCPQILLVAAFALAACGDESHDVSSFDASIEGESDGGDSAGPGGGGTGMGSNGTGTGGGAAGTATTGGGAGTGGVLGGILGGILGDLEACSAASAAQLRELVAAVHSMRVPAANAVATPAQVRATRERAMQVRVMQARAMRAETRAAMRERTTQVTTQGSTPAVRPMRPTPH